MIVMIARVCSYELGAIDHAAFGFEAEHDTTLLERLRYKGATAQRLVIPKSLLTLR
jgi:hypothetical protein